MATIRFSISPATYEIVAAEASRAGMTVAEFAREATIVRLAYWRAQRGEALELADMKVVPRREEP